MSELFLSLQRMWDRVPSFDVWAIAVSISVLGTKFCGDGFWVVFFLSCGMIAFDTVTKWLYICKLFIHDKCGGMDIMLITLRESAQVFINGDAWCQGYLSSRGFSRIVEKTMWYTAAIFVCFLAGHNMPQIHLFGISLVPSDVFPGTVSVAVFLVELSSINENLRLLGYSGLSDALKTVTDIIVNKFKTEGMKK